MLGADFVSRKPKIYNILAVSAFTMFLLNPYLLFDVGFQLSYLAVLGIVFFHPLIYRFFTVTFPIRRKKEYKVQYFFRALPSYCLDYLWQIICVSIAAQITTSPIALLYFHQFPNYFLLANLFAIPVSTGIMYLEIALLAFSWIHDYVGICFGFLTQYSIIFLNLGVSLIEKVPFSITSGISIAAWETWLLYLVVVLMVLLFYFRKLTYFILTTILIVSWCIFQLFEYNNHQKQQQFIVYQTPKVTALELCAANQSIFIADGILLANKNKLKFHTANYQFKRSASDILVMSIEDSILQISDNQIVKGGSKTNQLFVNTILETDNFRIIVYRKHKILWLKKKIFIDAIPKADFWLITENNFPKFPKSREKQENLTIYKPNKIIINGSNKRYQIGKFKELALKHDLPCHFTAEQGSFEF
jgi:competence protein ComEC